MPNVIVVDLSLIINRWGNSVELQSLSKYLALNHLIEHCLTSDNKWNDYESELIEIISSLDDGGDDLDINGGNAGLQIGYSQIVGIGIGRNYE